QPPHQGETPGDDLAIVELGNGREARALGDDEAQQQLALGAQDLLVEQGEEGLERLGRRHLGRTGEPAHFGEQRRYGVPYQRLEQRLLVAEVEIEGAL